MLRNAGLNWVYTQAAFALLAGNILVAADPASFEERKQHVRSLLHQSEFRAALEEAKAINRDWPDDIPAYQLMAEANLELGNYADAESTIQWMLDLRIGKADPRGWLLVARFREVTGDIDGAIEAVNLAFSRLAPGEELERRKLIGYAGRLQYLAGRLGLAEQALKEALNGVLQAAALETLARLRLAQGRPEDAALVFRQLVQSEPHPRYLYRLAEVTKNLADYATFERSARERMNLPDNANRELALYLAGPGKRPAEALAVARRESERRHDVYTLDALAVALEANGKSSEARSTMRSALAVGVRDPEILAHAGRMGVKPE